LDQLATVRRAFAEAPYMDGGATLRIALLRGPSPRLVLAGHEGAIDGLGLVALLGVVLGDSVTSGARGVGDASPRGSVLLSAAGRIVEAFCYPPARVARSGSSEVGEHLVARTAPRLTGGTAQLMAAALRAVAAWNRERGVRSRRLVLAIGASHRAGGQIGVGYDAAWFRLRLKTGTDVEARRALDTADPRPVPPPVESGAVLTTANRVLSRRLGSTLLVSNLGPLAGPPSLLSTVFYPVAYGRSGVALGALTLGDVTTLGLRARGRDFGVPDVESLADSMVREIAAGDASDGHQSAPTGIPRSVSLGG
jgi:hypothetical protein